MMRSSTGPSEVEGIQAGEASANNTVEFPLPPGVSADQRPRGILGTYSYDLPDQLVEGPPSTPTSVLIGVIQMNSTHDTERNDEQSFSLIKKVAQAGAKMVFLPEGFDYIARDRIESAILSQTMDGPLILSYRDLAEEHKIWISLGGFHERLKERRKDGLPWMSNTHVLINDKGQIVNVYRKIHLFEHGNEHLQTKPGTDIGSPCQTPIGMMGLGVCYDLRFPEFSTLLRTQGAQVLTYPSAFTYETGQAHWESLLRARAIENQCYVIAAAQIGVHSDAANPRRSYGKSMVVDPWGATHELTPLPDTGAIGVGAMIVEVDPNYVNLIREKFPFFQHRRPDVYIGIAQTGNDDNTKETELGLYWIPDPAGGENLFPFGHLQLKKKIVFLESPTAQAFVNRKCVLPGHVLITPKRVALRMSDLTAIEVADLFQLAQFVQQIVEELFHANSSTLTVQDGEDAGQSVKHVHIHVIPRKPMDLESNDQIYAKLASHDKGEVKWRDEEEMIHECVVIKRYIRGKHNFKVKPPPAPKKWPWYAGK